MQIGQERRPHPTSTIAAEAVATKAPVEVVRKRVQQRQGVAARATQGRPLTSRLLGWWW